MLFRWTDLNTIQKQILLQELVICDARRSSRQRRQHGVYLLGMGNMTLMLGFRFLLTRDK